MQKILIVLYLIITAVITYECIQKPEYNWDTLPYVASVYSLEGNDTNSIHKNTYDIVKNNFPEKEYEILIKSNNYREQMMQCARCFYQQLPFYKIRPFFIFLIFILYKLNVNIVSSPFLISSFSYFFICIIIFLWLNNVFKNPIITFAISVLLVISPFLLNSATEASPNTLSGLIILSSLLFLYKKNIFLACFLMLLSVFTRPDNLILVILFSAAYLFNENIKRNRIILGITIFLSIISFILIDKWSGNYGWAVLFEHSFNDRIMTPAEYDSHFNSGLYFSSFKKWLVLFKFSFIGLQVMMIILTYYLKSIPIKKMRTDLDIIFLHAVTLSIIIHYLIYPVMDDKYFIAQYIFIDIIFIKNLFETRKLLLR